MPSTWTWATAALALLAAMQGSAAPLLLEDGALHVIDITVHDGIVISNGTTAVVASSGAVRADAAGRAISTSPNAVSRVEVSGGTVQGRAQVHDFAISAGAVQGTVETHESPGGNIEITGGSVDRLALFGASAHVTGGNVGSIFMEAGTTLHVAGGQVTDTIEAISGRITLEGGLFGGDILLLMDTDAISVRGGMYALGTEFVYRTFSDIFTMTFAGALSLRDPVPLGAGIWETFISGTLLDGNEIGNRVICDQSLWSAPGAACAAITLAAPIGVATPGTLGLLLGGLLALLLLRRCPGAGTDRSPGLLPARIDRPSREIGHERFQQRDASARLSWRQHRQSDGVDHRCARW
jgi:hypothetical protein